MLPLLLELVDTPEERSLLEKVYIEYRGLMFAVAMGVLKDTMDAEDAVHQAFVSIAENIKSYYKLLDPGCPKSKALCVTIVKHKALDTLRRRNKVVELPFDDEIFTSPFKQGNFDLLEEAIYTLPENYKNHIILMYDVGLNAREIAKVLGENYETSRKTIYRAKMKIKEAMEKEK